MWLFNQLSKRTLQNWFEIGDNLWNRSIYNYIFLELQAGLQPTDDITVAYDIQTIRDNEKASYLQSVVQNYQDYIADATKQPISSSDSCLSLPLIIEEVMEVRHRLQRKLTL